MIYIYYVLKTGDNTYIGKCNGEWTDGADHRSAYEFVSILEAENTRLLHGGDMIRRDVVEEGHTLNNTECMEQLTELLAWIGVHSKTYNEAYWAWKQARDLYKAKLEHLLKGRRVRITRRIKGPTIAYCYGLEPDGLYLQLRADGRSFTMTPQKVEAILDEETCS